MAAGLVLRDRYALQRELGSGGFAVTWLAEDRQTGKPCVLKELRWKGVDTFKTIELFEREARVLRQLDHPRIPDFVDFFTVENPGQVAVYLVQEFVDGRNLAELVAEGRRFSPAQLVDIAIDVAAILAYLHGLTPPILHRDIKPSNVMLTPDGRIHLIDFGAVREHALAEEKVGGASSVVGTYGYMPLEQFEGRAVPASDIYSLGATLIYLASHREPWKLEKKAGLRLDFEAATQLPRPLGRVIARMVEPDWRERYGSARELQADLSRLARLAQHGFVAPARWHRRGAVAAVALLLAGLAVFVARRAPAPAPPASGQHAGAAAAFPDAASPAPSRSGQIRACQPETLAPGNVLAQPYAAPLDDGLPAGALRRLGTTRLRHATGRMAVALSPDGRLLASADQEISLWDARTGRELRRMAGHCNWISALCFAADGHTLFSASLDRSVRRWDVATGTPLAARELGSGLSAMAPTADGRSLILGAHGLRVWLIDNSLHGVYRVFEDLAQQGQGTNPLARIESVAGSPDGSLVAACDGRAAMVWKTMSGKRAEFGPPLEERWRAMEWVEFTDDQHLLLVSEARARVWDLDARRYVREIPFDYVSGGMQAALSPDRAFLAIAGTGPAIQMVDLAQGKRRSGFPASEWYVGQLAFSTDGQRLASAGWDGKVRLWDWRKEVELLPDTAPVNAIYRLAFASDGKTLEATHVWSQALHRWDVASGRHLGTGRGTLQQLHFALTGPVVSGGWSALLDADERAALRAFIDRGGFRLAFSNLARARDGALLLLSAEETVIRFFDVRSGHEVLRLPAPAPGRPGGRADGGAPGGVPVVAAPASPVLRVWFQQPGQGHEEVALFQPRSRMIVAAAFSPDGKRLALVDEQGLLGLWDVPSRKLQSVQPVGWTRLLAFAPDGRSVGLLSGQVELRDAPSGEPLGRVGHGHRGSLETFAFSPEGKLIATGGNDTTVLLWPAPERR